ncbi:HNH endonuclease signature motif containing protein [Marinobacteraceae bacterium S3BR75-40.1]
MKTRKRFKLHARENMKRLFLSGNLDEILDEVGAAIQYGFHLGLINDDSLGAALADAQNDNSKFKLTSIYPDLLACICKEEYGLKREVLAAPVEQADPFEKIKREKYIGLVASGGNSYEAEFQEVRISRRFENSLNRLNEERESRDRKDVELKNEIAKIRDKVYEQPTFPPKLRRIILERDGYRCQDCGRHKSDLIPGGKSLEIDHKVAVIDGGQTCYANGQTLCADCNIGKHHAKPFLKAAANLS